MIAVLAERRAERLQRVGRCADRGRALPRAVHQRPRPTASSPPTRDGDGDRRPSTPTRLAVGVPDRTSRPRPSTTPTTRSRPRSSTRRSHGVEGVIDATAERAGVGRAARHADLRRPGGVRHAADAPPHLVRVPGDRRPAAPPHRRAREMSQRQLPALVESLRTGGDVSADASRSRIDVQSEDEIGELAQAFNDVEAVTMRGRAGAVAAAAQGHGRPVREPGAPQPEPARTSARAARRARAQRARPRRARRALQARPHGDPHAPERREPARALRRRAAAPVAAADRARSTSCAPRRPRSPTSRASSSSASTTASRCRGAPVSDVAHLVAELLENATSFSPPDTAVVVSGAVTATGFVLAVSDQGIGMPPERIAEANTLLAKPPVVGLALSRALGLHVVGVARRPPRHRASSSAPGAPAALVALVHLPTAVLEPRAVPAPPAAGARARAEPGVRPRGRRQRHRSTLGARRVVSRPADEPPVEEWRREGLADDVPPGPARPTRRPTPPVVRPVAPASPAEPVPTPAPPRLVAAAPRRQPQPQPARTRRRSRARPVTPPPPPEADADARRRLRRRRRCPPGSRASTSATSRRRRPADDAVGADADADPMRPYRVHELLTRHTQGKQRGRTGAGRRSDRRGSGDDRARRFGHAQEDGR